MFVCLCFFCSLGALLRPPPDLHCSHAQALEVCLDELASDIELRTKELDIALKPAIDRLALHVSKPLVLVECLRFLGENAVKYLFYF